MGELQLRIFSKRLLITKYWTAISCYVNIFSHLLQPYRNHLDISIKLIANECSIFIQLIRSRNLLRRAKVQPLIKDIWIFS